MRTTVTLDPDVEALLRQRMRERDEPFKVALNTALRLGLAQSDVARARPFQQQTFHMGFRPELALDKALALAAAAEDDEIVRKLSLRK